MLKRRLGGTGLEVSALGFGAIKLPEVDAETARRALERALDLGITFIDTARGYEDSEAKIAPVLRGRREQVVLATKTAQRDAAGVRRDLERSLRELGTDYIDLYQLHSVSARQEREQVLAPGGALEACQRAREEGKIRHIGFTSHRALEDMKALMRTGEFSTIMVAYSPLDQEGTGADVIPLAARCDLGVIAMKPLCGGMLTSYPEDAGPEPRPEDPVVRGSLRCILSNPAVSVVIPGMMYPWQVEQNAAAGRDLTPFSEEERADLFARIGAQRKEFRYGQVCLRCGYCLPCPQGIEIPTALRAQVMYTQYGEPLRQQGWQLFQSLSVSPSVCEECRKCVEHCPAGLDIPARLREVMAVFQQGAGSRKQLPVGE